MVAIVSPIWIISNIVGGVGDVLNVASWIAAIILFLASGPVQWVFAFFFIAGVGFVFQDLWLAPVSRCWESIRQKHPPLVLEYNESKHSIVCADGKVKMVRLCVRNLSSRSMKNLMLTILEIEGPPEAREKYIPLLGHNLAVSSDVNGDYKAAWGNKPKDHVEVLHPGREAIFDFVRLTAACNFRFCHGSYVPGHPHQGIQRWDQQPSGVIGGDKYKVLITAQADDLKEITGMFEFDSDLSFRQLTPCIQTSHN